MKFFLVFNISGYEDVPAFIEMGASTLEAAQQSAPKVLLDFLSSDAGGGKEFSSVGELRDAISSIRLLEVTTSYGVDLGSQAFRDEISEQDGAI